QGGQGGRVQARQRPLALADRGPDRVYDHRVTHRVLLFLTMVARSSPGGRVPEYAAEEPPRAHVGVAVVDGFKRIGVAHHRVQVDLAGGGELEQLRYVGARVGRAVQGADDLL